MTIDGIFERMAAAYAAEAGFYPSDASDAGIRLHVLAGEIFNAYAALEQLRADAFPHTASGEALERHAAMCGARRKAAGKARGTLTFSRGTALSYDVTIPKGTVCASSVGMTEFETLEEAVLRAGETAVTVNAAAVLGGRRCNAAVGYIDTLVTPPAGIEAVTNESAFSGGTEAETDEVLRTRVLKNRSVLANGTNMETYRRAALETDGICHANVVPMENGTGTVSVYVYGDDAVPDAEAIAAVKAAVETLREINVTLTVDAAEAMPYNVTMYIVPQPDCALQDAKAICENAVRGVFAEKTVGEAVYAAEFITAVMKTGAVLNCVLPESVRDYRTAPNAIAVCGTVTVLEKA